jgi:esterase/lipase
MIIKTHQKQAVIFLLVFFLATLTGCKQDVALTIVPTNTTAPTPTLYPTATNTLVPSPEPTPTIGAVEELKLKARDGVRLKAYLYHSQAEVEKPIAVVLAHQMSSSHYEWKSFASQLAELGYTTLIFDFRGHGRSEGDLDFNAVGVDVASAIRYLNLQGYDRVVCMGASMGGSGCLAASLDVDLAGFVTLSGPMNIPGTSLVTEEDLLGLVFPKLFAIAEDDPVKTEVPTFITDFIHMYEIAPEPKELLLYPGTAHGTGMFHEDYGEELQTKLVEFLEYVITFEE